VHLSIATQVPMEKSLFSNLAAFQAVHAFAGDIHRGLFFWELSHFEIRGSNE